MLICCDNGAVITNGNDFLEQVQKTLGITMDDFVNGINMLVREHGFASRTSGLEDPVAHMFYDIYDDGSEYYTSSQDGIYGDDFYIASEALQNAQEEIRQVANCLMERSRKGNTRADLAAQLNNIASNMEGIL